MTSLVMLLLVTFVIWGPLLALLVAYGATKVLHRKINVAALSIIIFSALVICLTPLKLPSEHIPVILPWWFAMNSVHEKHLLDSSLVAPAVGYFLFLAIVFPIAGRIAKRQKL